MHTQAHTQIHIFILLLYNFGFSLTSINMMLNRERPD